MRETRLKLTPLVAGVLIALVCDVSVQAQTNSPAGDPLMDALIQKGILTKDEAGRIQAEIAARQSQSAIDSAPPVRWKMSDTFKNLQLYGDLRFRYEYRGADNAPGLSPDTYYRERFRYALRLGIRGDIYDNFNYGIRLETSANPRSPWVTFADDTGKTGSAAVPSGTPSDKSSDAINVGQVYLGWRPTDWYEMTIGKMPMPLYVTPMVWDSDINPEGAFEKFKLTIQNVDLFLDFGQFDYQDPNPASEIPSSDTFLLAWQAGANIRIHGDEMSLKVAPVIYTYTGELTSGGVAQVFVGQGLDGQNNNGFNQIGINDLLVLEVPAEFNFKIHNPKFGTYQARIFGDIAYNLQGNDRARAAFAAGSGSVVNAFPGLTSPVLDQNKAYQLGFGIGNAGPVYGPTQGLVYGSTSKKNTWEARVYWQHVEQYALDVNLMDSDFFEGRANLEGFYSAFAYSFTDAIIGTVRYGHANPINNKLGTGGSNLDLPGLNPIKDYELLQLDLTWRF